MKNVFLRNGLLGFGLVSSLGLWAQPIVIEAESPIESDVAEVKTFDAEGNEVSGGHALSLDNANKGSYAVYAFEAPEAGTYDLSVFYVSMNTRWISVQVNDQVANIVKCSHLTANWSGYPEEIVNEETGESEQRPGVASETVKVYCEKGMNFLTVKAIYGYSPEEGRDLKFAPTLDRYELEKSAEEIDRPQDWLADTDRITRECENYDAISGNASISDRAAFSGLKGANISAGGGNISYKVNAPAEGAYLMEIWYSTCQCRWISVKVNQQIPSYVSFADFSEGWGEKEGEWVSRRQVLVYLKAGENTITLGQYTRDTNPDKSEHGDSPALDFFTLDKVNYPDLTEPGVEIAMYKNALSDIAEWKSGLDTSVLNDHNEYTVAKTDATSAELTLEFPGLITMSGYAFATENNPEEWAVATSVDGEEWSTPDVSGTSQNGVIYFRSTSFDKEMPVKFVRLEMKGSEPIALGDFAVFGTPNQPLEDALLFEGNFDYESNNQGAQGWPEGPDKIFNGDPYGTRCTFDATGGELEEIQVTVYLYADAEVESYSISVHDTGMMDRSPEQWTLYAFDYDANDGQGDYVAIDDRKDMVFPVKASTHIMNVNPVVKTDTYMLNLHNPTKKTLHISDFQLYGKAYVNNGVESVEAPKAAAVVLTGKGMINILAAEGNFAVYDFSGKSLASGICNGSAQVNLPAGLYIVNVNGRASKVLVK